ncbi:MAG: ATP-grasp domain-containing protein [Abditibacteriota bacterium]|nr:ATP-grasp domain-containing protein [Abditibacteriota bacterium]
MAEMILFPSSSFDPKRVDEDLQREYEAAGATGLFGLALFDYDGWFLEDRLIVRGAPETETSAVYRGWMMKPDVYERFYELLLHKNIRLITEPEHYRLMHIFPNVYESVRDDTARMEIFPLHSRIDVERLKKDFPRFMIKDYVKSVKGTEFPRYFDQTITQPEFDRWMEVFYKYRGELLTGGICVKEYLDLKRYGERANEYRVFYINHEIATVCRNSGQGNYTPEPPKPLLEKYRYLRSPYYTVDYAELADGSWKILEAGDGGVSGLSDRQDPVGYYRALYQCLK